MVLDKAFIAVADFLAHALAQHKPLGVARFDRSIEHDRLLGLCANFIGYGPDGVTSLEISYIQSQDPRSVDALSCIISRGEKRLYVSHYLKHLGYNSTFLSNNHRRSPKEFIQLAVHDLGNIAELAAPLAGADMVDIPFDYEGYR
jgi:hypothetical protein